MKKYILLLCCIVFAISCSKDELYEIPKDDNGNIIWTGVSRTETAGISSLDNSFTVTATFATAKSGDVMKVELLQLQTPPGGGSTMQLLPLEGTQQDVSVGSDLKATVSYTRNVANLNNVGDYVVVVFNGERDYAKQRVEMINVMTVSKPMVADTEIEVARTDEAAYFNIHVDPKEGEFSGSVTVERKNGTDGTWVTVPGSPFSGVNQPYLPSISGSDFIVENDTMFYKFTAKQGSYSETIERTVIVREPYFYLKKSAKLLLGTSSAGINLLNNSPVPFNASTAMVAIDGSLMLKGGSAWIDAGNKIEFVPTTIGMYALNNSNDAIAAFNSGTPVTSIDPIQGEGVFIFKATTGEAPEDVYYGMIMVKDVSPNVSVSFEYRIGNMYAHLQVIM